MSRRKYKILSVSDKENMFLEYSKGLLSQQEVSDKYGVDRSVIRRLIKKSENEESFNSFTGKTSKTIGRPKVNFQNEIEELEYRRMVMSIEGKLRTLKKLKSQINSD